jgi:hypothetical protein
MHVGKNYAGKKSRQRNHGAFPEFHLNHVRSFPAHSLEYADLPSFAGAQARSLVPDENNEGKQSTAAEKMTIIMPPRQLKMES